MKISKFGHSCLTVEEGEAHFLIDPGAFSQGFEALRPIDAVLVTHQHQDHVTAEGLSKIRENNPEVQIFADEGSVMALANAGLTDVRPVHAGEEFEVKGVSVNVYGSKHAIIHPAIPGIENVGYMIADRFFYPGDNFTLPARPPEILAFPLGAPWLKVAEVIDYVVAVRPTYAIPVHDAVLAMPLMNINLVKKIADPEGITMQVVENGTAIEI